LLGFDFRPGTRVRFLTLILAFFAGLKMWTGFFNFVCGCEYTRTARQVQVTGNEALRGINLASAVRACPFADSMGGSMRLNNVFKPASSIWGSSRILGAYEKFRSSASLRWSYTPIREQ
jgi:hypothetical protein